MPTAKQRHASLHAASKATPPRREAGEKTRTKRSIQTSSMPRQRRGPHPQGRATRRFEPMPTAKQRHASLHAASKATPPRREAGEKTRTKRSIQTSSMPRQRRGPRPQGRATQRFALTPPLAPTQRPANFPKIVASCNSQVAPTGRGPVLCESGKENRKYRGLSSLQACIPAAYKSAAATPRSHREAGGKTEAATAKSHADSNSFHAVPTGRPRPQGRACGNRHPPTAKAPASTASPRRLCLKGRAAFQKLPPIAAYRNAFCRMRARSL